MADDTDATGSVAEDAPLSPSAVAPPVDVVERGPDVEPIATATVDESPPFVYAIGRIEPRFPSPAVEKELAQAMGRSDTAGLTDPEALKEVVSDRSNRYLVRQLAWVLTIEGLETYVLVPRDPSDLDLLVDAVRPAPDPADVDVVVGVRGPIAPPELAGGLAIPIVIYDQIYSFDTDSLISAIPRPDGVDEDRFRPAANELFSRLIQIADNAGDADEHRALNYLAVRYPEIYAETARAFERNSSLSAVDVSPSRLTGARKIVDVVFDYTNRQTDVVESYFARVDVTEEFPFLVTKLSPYYRR